MSFLTEPEPPRGIAFDVLPGIRRIVARNPSVMTYHGTNTWLLDHPDGLTVIDPGPDDGRHVQEILAAAGDTPIARIVVTHAHIDHVEAAKALQAATGAKTIGHGKDIMNTFTPDEALRDGDTAAGLTAVFTPGHAVDHLSFAYDVPGTGRVLFSGDHVMSWSSSIVSPPDGNMLDYYRSLELLLERDEALYLCGHGPVLAQPRDAVRQLLAHRQRREAAIIAAMLEAPSATVGGLADRLYAKSHPWLKIAAQRNVLAHMLKLRDEGRAAEAEPGDYDVKPLLASIATEMAKTENEESEIRKESGAASDDAQATGKASPGDTLRVDASRRFVLLSPVQEAA